MALHYLNLEQRVLDKVNRPTPGTSVDDRLVRFTNEAIKNIAVHTRINRARIIVGFIGGNVLLLEEDMPGTEEVGIPAYAYGLDGAFYIKHGLLIDNIQEVVREVEDESEGTYTYTYLNDELIYKKRQEEFWRKPLASARPNNYGTYRYWVTVPTVPADPPRTLYEPYETLGIWFENMFTNDATTDDRLFRVQYRRWGPAVNMTLLGSPEEAGAYTQPYIYLPDQYDKLLVLMVARQYLQSIGDKRIGLFDADIRNEKMELQLVDGQGGDVDYQWRFQTTDVIPRGGATRYPRGENW